MSGSYGEGVLSGARHAVFWRGVRRERGARHDGQQAGQPRLHGANRRTRVLAVRIAFLFRGGRVRSLTEWTGQWRLAAFAIIAAMQFEEVSDEELLAKSKERT